MDDNLLTNNLELMDFLENETPVQENNEDNSDQNQVENFVHKCGTCAKVFKLKHQLKRHIAAVHDEEKPFKCQTCNKTFSQKANLNQHISAVHEGKKPYICKICNVSFTKRHMKAHKAQHYHSENSLNCGFCHTPAFESKKSLMRHIKKYVLTCIAELC